jgi:hypothetical protein
MGGRTVKLTPDEIRYSREVAAKLGRDPDAMIAEGEQLKEQGYQRAHEAAAGTMGRVATAGGQMYPGGGPRAERDWEAGS